MLIKLKDIQLLTRNQTGVLYMVASVMCFAVMDLCVKWLNYYPFGEVFFARFFFGLIPIFLIIPRDRWKDFYKTSKGYPFNGRWGKGGPVQGVIYNDHYSGSPYLVYTIDRVGTFEYPCQRLK